MKNLNFLFALMLLIATFQGFAQCTHVMGPYNSQLVYNNASIGNYAWQNASNAQNSDNLYASCPMIGTNLISNYLMAIEFLIPVPSNAHVCGVELRIERHDGNIDSVTDYEVRLVENLQVVGINKASNTPIWDQNDNVVVYGGDTALWGLNLTPNDIYSGSFGAVISVREYNATNCTPKVDNMTMRVWYSLPTDVDFVANSSANISIYPNPADHSIKINLQNTPFANTNSQIIVADVLGNRIHQQESNDSNLTVLDVSTWNKGIYLLQIKSEKESVMRKIVVN